MFKEIETILSSQASVFEKQAQLTDLRQEIIRMLDEADEQVTAGYKYCPSCNQWYKTSAWETKQKTERREYCAFHSLAEWGEDEYEFANFEITYDECPVGHSFEVKAIQLP